MFCLFDDENGGLEDEFIYVHLSSKGRVREGKERGRRYIEGSTGRVDQMRWLKKKAGVASEEKADWLDVRGVCIFGFETTCVFSYNSWGLHYS